MEAIEYLGVRILVREVARPKGWDCRVLVAEDGTAYLEYLLSVGPYKVDVASIHQLMPEDLAAYEAGRLDLGAVARNLAYG